MINTGKSILMTVLSDPTFGIGLVGTMLTDSLHTHHEHSSHEGSSAEWSVLLPAIGTFIWMMARAYREVKRKE